MNRKSALLTALVAGLLPVAAFSQVSPAPPAPASPAPATQAAPAPVPPQVAAPQPIPAKIALVAFQECVINTNEGKRAVDEITKKYEPQKEKLDTLNKEIESLKKQLQAAPATMPDEERASRTKTIDTKEKQYSRDVDDAQNAYQADLQEAYNKVATKVNILLQSYANLNGYTLVLDVSNQASAVMFADTKTDITEALINAYNVSSGVPPPVPAAPSAGKPTTPKPSTPAAPRPTTPARPPSQ